MVDSIPAYAVYCETKRKTLESKGIGSGNKKLKVVSAICGAVFFSACSSSSDDSIDVIDLPGIAVVGLNGAPPEQVTNPWFASIRTFRLDSQTPGTGDADISTLQYSALRSMQDHIDTFNQSVQLESCDIRADDVTSDTSSSSSNRTFVSAGAEMVINTPNGPWYNIPQGDIGQYGVDDELPDAFPAGATLSIPGDVFPSVAAYPIAEPAPVVRISPMAEEISILDQYRWEPVGGPGMSVRISLLEYDSNGDLIGFLLNCDVEDDGEFELTEEALNAIQSTADGSVLRARYSRAYRRLEVFEGVIVAARFGVGE